MASPDTPIRLRACSTCSRLKMKCRWPENTEPDSSIKCIRCARMKQPCQVPDPVQRRRRGKSTRVAQLEEKLDGLVHMLAAHQKSNAISPSSQAPITPESNNPSQSSPAPAVIEAQYAAKRAEAALPALVGDASLEFIPGFGVTVTESEQNLDLYREEYMPRYPFVVISRSISAQELYRDSPCLFWAVMAILVLIAWNMVQNYIDAEADDFLSMAICIVNYLRLDRPLDCFTPGRKTLLGAAWAKMKRELPFRGKETQTTADKRAVLGCYHVSAMVGGLFRRGPHLRWNDHLSAYCDQLVAAHEDELDLYSAALAKMFAIAERGYNVIPHIVSESEAMPYHAEHDMIINATERALQEFLQTLRISVRSSNQIQTQYQLCLVRLFEPLISMKPPAVDIFMPAGQSGVFLRTKKIWKFIAAAKEIFRRQLECSSAHVAMRPYHECAPLAFAVVWSSRVLFLEASDWEPALARSEFDYPTIVGSLSKQFADAETWALRAGVRMVMLDDKSTMLGMHSTKMSYIKTWFDTRLEEENAETSAESVDAVTPADGAATARACGAAVNGGQDTQMQDLTSQEYLNDFTLANLGGNNDQFWQEYMFFQPPSFYANMGTTSL